ncbi:virion structural protein [Klebsiella phage phi1_175008]|uniref:Virion structural protein n=1 Tax=Klebsiella phage phi1_175008 TaxID=3127744 RepID=A0ACD5FRT1_9CAUD
MTVSTFSEASRATTNTGYNVVFIEDRSVYFSWLLKTDEYPDQTYTVTLDGVDYDIRLRWNTRDESWQMLLGLSGDEPSVTFKVTNGLDLLMPYKYMEAVPDGELYLVDTVKINGRPNYDDTGIDKRFVLVYIDSLPNQA